MNKSVLLSQNLNSKLALHMVTIHLVWYTWIRSSEMIFYVAFFPPYVNFVIHFTCESLGLSKIWFCDMWLNSRVLHFPWRNVTGLISVDFFLQMSWLLSNKLPDLVSFHFFEFLSHHIVLSFSFYRLMTIVHVSLSLFFAIFFSLLIWMISRIRHNISLVVVWSRIGNMIWWGEW